MSWNYRIFRHVSETGQAGEWSEYYQLHEAYYPDDCGKRRAKPDGWTEESPQIIGDTVDELINVLEMMLKDAKKCKKDILDYK